MADRRTFLTERRVTQVVTTDESNAPRSIDGSPLEHEAVVASRLDHFSVIH
jgi:hypothetical protein